VAFIFHFCSRLDASVHSKWFNLSVDKFDAIHYSGMALFKIGIFLFNLVPYLALRIVG